MSGQEITPAERERGVYAITEMATPRHRLRLLLTEDTSGKASGLLVQVEVDGRWEEIVRAQPWAITVRHRSGEIPL